MGERSLYETATQEVITMYNDEFNNNDMYRFTNREVPHDDYAPGPDRAPAPAPKGVISARPHLAAAGKSPVAVI